MSAKAKKSSNSQESQSDGKTVPMGVAVAIISVFVIAAAGLIGTIVFFAMSNPFVPQQRGGFTYAAGASGAGDGVFINGVWESQGLTYNDEFVTIEFMDNRFTKITEMYIADADVAYILGNLDEIREFHRSQSGGTVEVLIDETGAVLLRVRMDGTFGLTENELRLVSGDNLVNIFPFSWDGRSITINNDLFVQGPESGPGGEGAPPVAEPTPAPEPAPAPTPEAPPVSTPQPISLPTQITMPAQTIEPTPTLPTASIVGRWQVVELIYNGVSTPFYIPPGSTSIEWYFTAEGIAIMTVDGPHGVEDVVTWESGDEWIVITIIDTGSGYTDNLNFIYQIYGSELRLTTFEGGIEIITIFERI